MRSKGFSLRLKFTIMTITIGLISFGVATLLSNQWMAKGLEQRYKKEAMLITTDILHELESAMKSGAHREISEALNVYRSHEEVEEVRVFDLKDQEVFTEQKGHDEARVKEILKTKEIIQFDKE